MDFSEIPSRVKKNASLYKKMIEENLDDGTIKGESIYNGTTNTIDVDKLRDMLDKKYRPEENPVSLRNPDIEEFNHPVNLEETREYDIRDLLEKAKNEQVHDYEEERFKKAREISDDFFVSEVSSSRGESKTTNDPEKISKLLNTITLKEMEEYEDMDRTFSADPLDILTDLKGEDDRTKVMGAKDLDDTVDFVKQVEETNTNLLFHVSTIEEDKENTNKEESFEDFDDLYDGPDWLGIIIKILVFLIVVAVLVGGVILCNTYFNLGWF